MVWCLAAAAVVAASTADPAKSRNAIANFHEPPFLLLPPDALAAAARVLRSSFCIV